VHEHRGDFEEATMPWLFPEIPRGLAGGACDRPGWTAHKGNSSATVADLMRTPVAVAPDASLAQIADVLITHNLNVVPVVAANGTLRGMVRDTNLITRPAVGRRIGAGLRYLFRRRHGRVPASLGPCAQRLMTRPVDTAHPREGATVVLHRMLTTGREHLPVVRGGKLVGMLDRVDLIKAFNRPDAAIEEEVRATLGNPLRVPAGHRVVVEVSQGVVRVHFPPRGRRRRSGIAFGALPSTTPDSQHG
jgi:CBS domain-containing protein